MEAAKRLTRKVYESACFNPTREISASYNTHLVGNAVELNSSKLEDFQSDMLNGFLDEGGC